MKLLRSLILAVVVLCVGALMLERFNVINLDDVFSPPPAQEQPNEPA